jgi:hypothetical protein
MLEEMKKRGKGSQCIEKEEGIGDSSSIGPSKAETILEENEKGVSHGSFCIHIQSSPGHIWVCF